MNRLILSIVAVTAVLLAAPVLMAQEKEDEPEIREYDEILVKDAMQPLIGTVVRITETHYYIRTLTQPDVEIPIPKEIVVDFKARTTPLMAFNIKRSRVQVGDFKACYELAKWSLQFPKLHENTKEVLRDAVKIDAKFLDAYLLLSDLLGEEYRKTVTPTEKQLNDEIELYRHAIGSGVNDPRIYYRLGLAVRKTGLLRGAIPILRKALETSASAGVPEIGTWSRHEIGEMLLELGQPEEALKEFEAVLASSPDDFRSLLGKGEAKVVLGELDEAEAALAQAATIDPYYPKPFALLGSIAYLKGELQDAQVWLGRAQAVGLPDAAVLTTLGLVHARMGKFTSAATELAQALTVDPGNWRAEVARGYLAENENKGEDAISAYMRAIEIEPASGVAYFKLAGAYYAADDKDSASRELTRALKNGYRPVEVFKFLGRIEYELGNYDVAARNLRYSIAADDKDADAHYLLAMSCVKLKLDFLARRHLERAVELNSAHVEALDALGYLAYTSGDLAGAMARFMSVLVVDPDDAYAGDAITKINQILYWDLWEDSFTRSDSDDVSNDWTEENDGTCGIEMKIESNAARFSGTQREGGKRPFLRRTESGSAFKRIEAVLNGLDAAGARFGLRIEKRGSKGEIQGAVILIKDVDGSLAYNFTEKRGKWKSVDMPIAIGRFPLDTESHTLGIGLDYKTGNIELILDGVRKALFSCAPLARVKELVVGVYGQAEAGIGWTLVVEKVRVFRQRPGVKKSGSGF